jgi:hypothetical protein
MTGRTIRTQRTILAGFAVAMLFHLVPAQAAMDGVPGSVAGVPSGFSKPALSLVTPERAYDFQVAGDAVEPESLRYEQIRMDEYGLNSAASPRPSRQLFPNVFWNQNQLIVRWR